MPPIRNFKRFLGKALRQPFYAASVGWKRIQAGLAYNFGRGKSSPPEAITFFLTRLCNLRCKMCGQWGDNGAAKSQESELLKARLSLEEIRKIVDEISAFRPNITLFGGEPLLHPDILKIISYIKGKGLHCLMITNGTLLPELAAGLVEAGLDELNVSVDGPGQLHDQIRGLPGAFDKISRGIGLINAAKGPRHQDKPLVNIQCTINRHNYQRLDELIEAARQFKANAVTFHNLIFLNQEAIAKQKRIDGLLNCSSQDWEGFIFEPGIDSKKLYQKLKAILSREYPFSVDYFPNLSEKALLSYYRDDYIPQDCGGRCLSPWACAYIFPEGEVKPCLNSSYSFGSIKNQAFREIWNSQKAIEFRRLLKENKIFPACVRCTELYRY